MLSTAISVSKGEIVALSERQAREPFESKLGKSQPLAKQPVCFTMGNKKH
jgi:hypothetical protein